MKFSIRDLLLVTVIVAILVSWCLEHQRQAREIRRLKRPDFAEEIVFPWTVPHDW